MELETIKDNKVYKKCKTVVKTWEKEFKLKHSRIPSKCDIKEAPPKVKYAYKKYFELKSAALENSLDIGDLDESIVYSPENSFNLMSFIDQEIDSEKSDTLINSLPNEKELEKLLSTKPLIEKNLSTVTKPTMFNNVKVSNKLFQNSKFSLRNPRKSIKSQHNETSKSISIDVKDGLRDKQFKSINDSEESTNLSCSKIDIIENVSTKTTNPISIAKPTSDDPINICIRENEKVKLRQFNEAWLDRVTGSNTNINTATIPEKFGINNINIKIESKLVNKVPDDLNCDYVENSESDNDDFANLTLKSSLKRRKTSSKIKSKEVDHTNKDSLVPIPSKRNKQTKMNDTDNEFNPPTVDEFAPFGVETNLLPRNISEIRSNNCLSRNSVQHGRNKPDSADRLEQKIKNGTLNDNFVKINIEKKVFVRGKKSFNMSKYKKQQNKSKKMMNSGMEFPESGKIECFKCGGIGHMARYCKAHKGDILLPLNSSADCVPTLEDMQHKSKEGESTSHDLETSICTFKPCPIPESVLSLLSETNNQCNDTLKPIYSNIENVIIEELYTGLKMFGHDTFRPGQEDAIKRILCGYSTLLLLPTGCGKSLCYQLPAYMYSKAYKCITLVISPLVSLMEDQVVSMPSFLKAGCLHTNQPPTQRKKIVQLVKDGEINILLISPEALISGEGSGFGGLLKFLPPIAFVCIDEAHCVSQWSHNFRPSYLMICRVLQEKLKVGTILGLTATASQTTVKSIISHINIPDGLTGIITCSELPSNLILTVSQENNKDIGLITLLSSEPINSYNSIIVYCIRRDECERIATLLRSSLQDPCKPMMEKRGRKRKPVSYVAEAYHAGMSGAQRRRIQNNFMDGALRIIVATVAFGMGINKLDIRCIVHYDMPSSFESYVQEIGRAGRDGKEANCHVFIDNKNRDKNELLKHIYSNSIDRPIIRKLLQKVFLPCNCLNQEENQRNDVRCKGHEVAIPIDQTVEELDLASENISTLLCYLELHPQKIVKVLHNTYTNCKIVSYGGVEKILQAAVNCPPLALAYNLKKKKASQYIEKLDNIVEFPVIEIAAELGWESGVSKYHLKNLEWVVENGVNKRSQLKVEFNSLGFRIRAPGDLTPVELDKMLDYLHNTVTSQEKAKLSQLHEIHSTLQNINTDPVEIVFLKGKDFLIQKSHELKKVICCYFQREDNVNVDLSVDVRPLNEEHIISDARALISSYRDCKFTGRSIARIFQGIPSPNYPAIVWGRCKFWRSHMHEDFYGIVRLATQQIIDMTLNY